MVVGWEEKPWSGFYFSRWEGPGEKRGQSLSLSQRWKSFAFASEEEDSLETTKEGKGRKRGEHAKQTYSRKKRV